MLMKLTQDQGVHSHPGFHNTPSELVPESSSLLLIHWLFDLVDRPDQLALLSFNIMETQISLNYCFVDPVTLSWPWGGIGVPELVHEI